MPVLDVKNLEGKTVGQVELADDVFGAEVNQHLLHEAVRHLLAGERAGTHKTKDKSEVSGSGKKLWKQKGTGRARIGSIRSPLWRHGGTVHGPVPRKYDYALPKKMILGALRSALSVKTAQQKLTVIEEWALGTHKTKALSETLGKLNGETRTILLVENEPSVNLERASRNLDGVTLLPTAKLDTYELMRHEHLMLSREAALKLSRGLSANKREESGAASEPEVAAAAKPAPAPRAVKEAKPVKAKATAKTAKKLSAKAEKKDKPKASSKAKKE
jgi:large subunit ribosomal protein L4